MAAYRIHVHAYEPAISRALTNSHVIGLLSTPEYTPPIYGRRSPATTSSRISAPSAGLPWTAAPTRPPGICLCLPRHPANCPFGASFDFNSTNYNQTGLTPADQLARLNNYNFARDLQTNLYDVRLRFQWPLLPNGTVGVGRQTYRTLASGQMTRYTNVLFGVWSYFIQPQFFRRTPRRPACHEDLSPSPIFPRAQRRAARPAGLY